MRSAVRETLRLAVVGSVGVVALLVGFGRAPEALTLNLFWFALLFAAGTATGWALGSSRAAILAAEGAMAIAVIQGAWSVALPAWPDRPPIAGARAGMSWRLSFTAPDQMARKILPLPIDWQVWAVYVRIDLGSRYAGPAGFRVAVNGREVGVVDRTTSDLDSGPIGVPAWAIRVPRAALERAPLAEVTLRPAGLDPLLSIAGQSDPRIEAAGRWNSWFFDGTSWRSDALAGLAGGHSTGTYRIWLEPAIGERE
jgi:hypothetical protein